MGTGDTTESRAPSWRRTLLWVLAYSVACVVGRNGFSPSGVPLAESAVGVAMVWLASGNRASWRLDGALIASISVVSGVALGHSWLAALLGLVMIAPAAAIVAALHRQMPDTWGGGGTRAMSRLSDFGWFVLVALAATVAAALLRTGLGVLLIDRETWDIVALRGGRALASLVALGTFGLLLGGRLAERRTDGGTILQLRRWEAVEAALILAATGAVFWIGFVRHPNAPTTFILVLGVVWTSIRFSPLVSASHAVMTGLGAVILTFLDYGPISNVVSIPGRALVAQIFVVVMMVTGMAVSLSRRQIVDTISRLSRSEARLAVRAAELDLMLANLTDGVAIIEEGGRVVHSNTALNRLLTGDPTTEPFIDRQVGRAGAHDLHHADGRPLLDEEAPHLRAMRGEVVEPEEFQLRHPSIPGGRVLELSALALPVEYGAPRRAMLTVRDVTAETAHREALSEFAATVAHDLNNPLSVLAGWTEALEEEFRAKESLEAASGMAMLGHIRLSTDRMREFIADLLAHAVAQDQNLHCERVDLWSLVKNLTESRTAPGADAGRIEYGELPEVWADRALVVQLLDNLVGNAFKYVAPGTVPRVAIAAETSESAWATIRVCDNGIGIAPEARSKVFETFHRADRETYRGTGLGLAICKRIVERHGGRIAVADNPDGPGSCFEFTLPTTSAALAAAVSS